jgi:hypothetical protein
MEPKTQIQKFIQGLQIIDRYNPANYDMCAEHDIIHAGHNIQVSETDKKVLEEAGWHWDTSVDSWAFFV